MKKNKYIKAIWLIANFSLLIILSGCAELFQGKVDMQSFQSDSLSRLVGTDETGKLDAPTGFYATKGSSPKYIDLSWEKVPGARSYLLETISVEGVLQSDGSYLYEAPDKDSSWETLENTVFGNSYRHNILQALVSSSEEYTKRFYYRVVAKNDMDKRDESEPSSMDYGSLFSPPMNVSADKGEDLNKINITWNAVENAASYDIYRSRNSDGSSPVFVGNRPANRERYTDIVSNNERGINFYYKIYAQNNRGVQSAESSVALGFARVPGAPPIPTNVEASKKSAPSTIKITWNLSSGATKYYIYRSSSKDSSIISLTLNGVNTTSYDDKRSIEPGVYYYYQIQSAKIENGEELRSAFSKTDRSSITDKSVGFLISPPTVIDADKKDGKIFLRWLPAIGRDEDHQSYTYNVYEDSDKDGPFTSCIKSDVSNTLNDDGYVSVEFTPTSVNHVFFRIETKSGSVSSVKSTVVSPSPAAAIDVVATEKENTTKWGGGTASRTTGVYPVYITWRKPANDNPAGYHVYRSLNPATGYRKITNAPVTETSYLDSDETMKVGKYYYYKVLSLNVLGQGKNYSDYDIGYGALTHEQFLKEFNKQIKSSQKKMTYMHKGGTSALGSETKYGNYSGSLSYRAVLDGLGARITMPYSNYCDALIDNYFMFKGGNLEKNEPSNYFEAPNDIRGYMIFNGNTNTSANMSSNGTMDGIVTVTGMYKGSVKFDNIVVRGGVAGGGHYPVDVDGFGNRNIPYNVIN